MSAPLCPLDQDLAVKLGAVGGDLQGDIQRWIETMTGEKFPNPNFGKSLKNGILLCKLANAIRPGVVPKIQTAAAPFVQMENINAFLNAEKIFGVPTPDLFMTVDLFEEKNIGQVIRSLATLRRLTGAESPVAGAPKGLSPASQPPRKLSSGTAPAKPAASSASSSSSSGGGGGAGAGKFCVNCGSKIAAGGKFCGECGQKL